MKRDRVMKGLPLSQMYMQKNIKDVGKDPTIDSGGMMVWGNKF